MILGRLAPSRPGQSGERSGSPTARGRAGAACCGISTPCYILAPANANLSARAFRLLRSVRLGKHCQQVWEIRSMSDHRGNPIVRAAVRLALAGNALAAFGVAHGQAAPAAAPPVTEEVVVTGSRIVVPNE